MSKFKVLDFVDGIFVDWIHICKIYLKSHAGKKLSQIINKNLKQQKLILKLIWMHQYHKINRWKVVYALVILLKKLHIVWAA